MSKKKTNSIVTIFILFVIPLFLLLNGYMSNIAIRKNNEITDWKVAITSDAKDLEDTQEINFKVENSSSVVNGKIAPGLKAIANVEIDLTGTNIPVDICATIDDMTLNDSFRLTAILDGEKYNFGTIKTMEIENNSRFTKENGNKILTLELEWIDNDNENDTILGKIGETITVPVTIKTMQHI